MVRRWIYKRAELPAWTNRAAALLDVFAGVTEGCVRFYEVPELKKAHASPLRVRPRPGIYIATPSTRCGAARVAAGRAGPSGSAMRTATT